jgi:hypothetical protein
MLDISPPALHRMQQNLSTAHPLTPFVVIVLALIAEIEALRGDGQELAAPCSMCDAGVPFEAGLAAYHVVDVPAPPGAAELVRYSYKRCTAEDRR